MTAVLWGAVEGPTRRGGRLCPFVMVKLLLQHGARVGKDASGDFAAYHVILLLRAGWHTCEIHHGMAGKVRNWCLHEMMRLFVASEGFSLVGIDRESLRAALRGLTREDKDVCWELLSAAEGWT